MTLLSAFEDLVSRTLSALPGTLEKLEYVAGLKQADGRYTHWGLAKVHGEAAVQEAVAEAHSLLIGEMLRTPLRSLMEDAKSSCAARQRPAVPYLEELSKRTTSLLPSQAGGESTRHFNSVLHALSALARSQQRATRPGA